MIQTTYKFKKGMFVSQAKCFGFYNGSRICESCPLRKDCKYVLVSCGFDIFRSVLSEMAQLLPDGTYQDSDRMPVLVDQITGTKLPGVDDSTLTIFDDVENGELDLSKLV